MGTHPKNEMFLRVCFSVLSSFILICIVAFNGTYCYQAQQGISGDKTEEHSLIGSAANQCASFYKVVTVDGVLLCFCISLTWLHSV